MIEDIESQEHYDSVVDEVRGERIMMVMFYANWCGPYKCSLPHVTRLAGEIQNKCTFYKLNVTDHDELVKLCRIFVLPTYLVYADGKVIDMLVAPGLEKLRNKIDYHQKQHRRQLLHRHRYHRSAYEGNYCREVVADPPLTYPINKEHVM